MEYSMSLTTTQLIQKYQNEIETLEKKINHLERVSDKLIEARGISVLQKVVKDLQKLNQGAQNG